LPFITAGKPTVTDFPASEAVATFDHTDVVITEFGCVPTSVHPAGPVNDPVVTPVAVNTKPSPAVTAAGTVTDSDAAVPVTPAAPTNPIAAGDPELTDT
jgi:hypothetical protein